MKFLREDHDNCRVYYRGADNGLYAYQEDEPNAFTLYRCSRDGEPSYEVPAVMVEACPGETMTGESLNDWLKSCPAEIRSL